MADEQTWIVITSNEQPIQQVSKELREKGFTIEDTLEAIGQLVVKGDEKMKQQSLKIKGVTDIVPSGNNINIGDPGSDLTW